MHQMPCPEIPYPILSNRKHLQSTTSIMIEKCPLWKSELYLLMNKRVCGSKISVDVYQQLRDLILNGFPTLCKQLQEACMPYWNVRAHLTLDDNLIVCGCRLLIPARMQQETLAYLHDSHQGSLRTKQRARLTVYWLGTDNDMDNTVLACKQCQDLLPSNTREPIVSKPTPTRPFQEIAGDFCSYAAQSYLILVDCYSDWPDIIPMGHNTTMTHLTKVIRQSFCRTGVPN